MKVLIEVIHIHVLYEREQWTKRRGLKRDFRRVSVPFTAVTNSECCPRKAEMNSKALGYHSHLLEAASPTEPIIPTMQASCED